MSVAALHTGSRELASAMRLQALAMWRAQPGALMLLGRTDVPLPKAGSLRMSALPGIFRAECWPLGGEPGYGFLVAVRLPPTADRTDRVELTLCGARSNDSDFRLMLIDGSEEAEFGQQVASLTGLHAARLTRFMLDVMRSQDAGDIRQPRDMLSAFLAHAARTDGCVELIMHVPKRCVLLQGWGVRSSEPIELLLPGASVLRHPALSGDFTRTDLEAPATGSILALPPETVDVMTGLEQVYLLSGDDLVCRRVVEPRVIDPDTSIGQIRHLLPRLKCSLPMQTLLRTTLQPQFDGRDTLNSAGRPVRAALDMAVAGESGGAYVSGWVFDPADRTIELHLCIEDFSARLDESWVRVPRQDVSTAFAGDQTFPAPLRHDWGFAVFTPHTPSPGESAYLRFTFSDGDLAFVPIRFSSPDAPAVRETLLASVDMHKPSALQIIEQHLAPFVAGLPPTRDASSHVILRGPLNRARALVVPLRTARLPRSFVSSLLLDPATSDEQIVFVCGREWNHAQLEALIDLIRFYELPASIVGVAQTPLPAEAVCHAAGVSKAESFLLGSPGLVGSGQGWRDSLQRSAGVDPVACPTVLFEDRSVRFAGPKRVTFLDRAPFASVQAPMLGANADLAWKGEPTRAECGTFACCLIRRVAIPSLITAARFITEAGQEAAFFLSLREAGLHGTWVPTVRVSAPEEDLTPVVAVAPLIDGWILRKTWGEALPCAS